MSSGATEQIGVNIGAHLRGGETIELISDLGGGKTTLVRGLARGAGSNDVVSSPSFTISKVYQAGSRQIHHFDFYRLHEPGVVEHELVEAAANPNNVVVVEWGEIVADVLPKRRLVIGIRRTGRDSRELTLSFPEDLSYLVEKI